MISTSTTEGITYYLGQSARVTSGWGYIRLGAPSGQICTYDLVYSPLSKHSVIDVLIIPSGEKFYFGVLLRTPRTVRKNLSCLFHPQWLLIKRRQPRPVMVLIISIRSLHLVTQLGKILRIYGTTTRCQKMFIWACHYKILLVALGLHQV